MNDSLILETHEARKGEALTQLGLKLTKVYFILLLALFPAASVLGWIKWEPIAINEIGDFLAGIFGPLSIFWIVLGFMQQGGELRLQVAELSRSVEQQKELVSVSRETLDHERDMQMHREAARKAAIRPKFVVSDATDPMKGFMRLGELRTVAITNIGNNASDVHVDITSTSSNSTLVKSFWAKGDAVHHDVYLGVHQKDASGEIFLRYSDDDDVRYNVKFKYRLSMFGFHCVEVGNAEGESAI